MKCPDCGAAAGEPHKRDCDLERCSICSLQKVTCDCEGHNPLRSVWTGRLSMPKNVSASLQLATDKRLRIRPSQCYYNAFQVVLHCKEFNSATYVEGIAVLDGLELEHGWIEHNDEIIDPTLPNDPLVYFSGLRFEGEIGISKAIRIPKQSGENDLPIFYRFGWGGSDSPEFMAAREAGKRLRERIIEGRHATN